MKMMKAVALFDYNGRTNKELSFKTNQIIFIYKKLNHQWWLGHIAGRNQSGFIPDGYIKLKSSRRDSAPVQHLPPLSIKPNASSSLHLINFPTSSDSLISTNDHDHSSSHSTSITDIDRTLRECHAQYFHTKSSSNTQQEIDAPDLVLNLPISNGFLTSKSLDENIPIVHSTIIIDFERKNIPPPIMKKPEKTMQLIERLGLQHQSISISRSSKATEV